MTSEIARRVIESFRQKTQTRDESAHLSLREEQILVLLSQGYSNKTIADKLGLSIDTVCGHLKWFLKIACEFAHRGGHSLYGLQNSPTQAGQWINIIRPSGKCGLAEWGD
jgi:hypothetical protein